MDLNVNESVVIAQRFRGPPHSGQGGYSCGVVADRIDGNCATVTIRKPPPLDRSLRIARAHGQVQLLDGDALIAEATRDSMDLDVPEPVELAAAQHASEHPILERAVHPFSGLLRLRPGPRSERGGRDPDGSPA